MFITSTSYPIIDFDDEENLKMSGTGRRMFFEELSKLLRRIVTIVMVDGKKYVGNFDGYNPETMSICLTDATDDEGKIYPKIFLNGSIVAQILTTEKSFDLKSLAERLERVFPRMVKLYDEIDVIVVMDKIRVDASGILEGSGPAAERVQKVYDEFVKEAKTS
jgi:small nuclear ribonucleoprotein (snRNP)-like protein